MGSLDFWPYTTSRFVSGAWVASGGVGAGCSSFIRLFGDSIIDPVDASKLLNFEKTRISIETGSNKAGFRLSRSISSQIHLKLWIQAWTSRFRALYTTVYTILILISFIFAFSSLTLLCPFHKQIFLFLFIVTRRRRFQRLSLRSVSYSQNVKLEHHCMKTTVSRWVGRAWLVIILIDYKFRIASFSLVRQIKRRFQRNHQTQRTTSRFCNFCFPLPIDYAKSPQWKQGSRLEVIIDFRL